MSEFFSNCLCLLDDLIGINYLIIVVATLLNVGGYVCSQKHMIQ